MNGGLVGPGGFISKIRLRPGELLLGSRGIPAYPGDSGIVFYLGHNEENLLYVAPLGAPPFQEPEWPYPISATWILVGPVGDLPSEHPLGDVAVAYRRAVAMCQ